MLTQSLKSMLIAAGVVASMSFAASNASAVFTPVLAPPSGEMNHNQILDQIYAGTFAPSGVNYLGTAGINAVRIDDSLDQLWSGEFVSYIARARFASWTQSFGYFAGHSGGSYTEIFNVVGTGYGVDEGGPVDPAFVQGSLMRWGRNGNNGGIISSLQTDNPGGNNDHLVTYQVTGLTGGPYDGREVFLLFWEDQNLGDADYNDLVVELVRVPAGGGQDEPGVPEPLSATLGLISASGLVLAATRRRKA